MRNRIHFRPQTLDPASAVDEAPASMPCHVQQRTSLCAPLLHVGGPLCCASRLQRDDGTHHPEHTLPLLRATISATYTPRACAAADRDHKERPTATMARRRRRKPRWYELRTPGRDPRLWLYGPVPTGFWKDRENRHQYLDWLGEQLGHTKPEHWYQLAAHAIKTRRGSRLLQEYRSLFALLLDYRPKHHWLEWRCTVVPRGFWADHANRRRYLDWLGAQLGYHHTEDWQRLRVTDVLQHHGERLLTLFQRQVSAIVNEYLRGGPTRQQPGSHVVGS